MNSSIKIYGERNSGTNLVRYLLSSHNCLPDDTGMTGLTAVNWVAMWLGKGFPRLYDEIYDRVTVQRHRDIYGWKHCAPDGDWLVGEAVVPIIVVKHPVFWRDSFLSKPFHMYEDCHTYMPRRIENMSRKLISFEELIFYKLASYRRLLEKCGGVLIQYETLVNHFQQSRKSLEDIFGSCGVLPSKDVRAFVRNSSTFDLSRFSNQVLDKESTFSIEYLKSNEELLKFFGYEVQAWKMKLPSLL